MAKNKNKGKPRNYALDSGVYRFSASKMFHKKAIHKFLKKTVAKKPADKKPVFVEKKIKGDKNGGTRMVRVKKLTNNVPTMDVKTCILHTKGKSVFSKHSRKLRPSLTPGVVAIILAGVHKGKRVVVLKQLETGLLLITGPLKLNGCPLRRINQRYLLATKTSINVSGVKVPETINDKYFARVKSDNKVKKDGNIFENKKEDYKPSEQRKADQASVDKQVLEAIKKHPQGAALKSYFKAGFGLNKGEYPHKMIF
uniref:Large ribosomal subunit protein eL6 n=1 Tax=Pseudodiaptomus poplesia TaxID=213370 RepID=A0A0U2MA36_9MAXI|nr:60S ribosomal protein L6 [Pseudodiaptomus poplesia]